jgi:hypothetical protein
MENTYKSQRLFFERITPNKLNELLKRADLSTHVLEDDINGVLQGLICKVKIGKDEETNIIRYSIYINLFEVANQVRKVGHVSIHIYPEYMHSPNGRIHAKNNINKQRKHTIKVNKNSTNKIKLSATAYPSIIRPQLKKPIDDVLHILTDYLDPLSPLFLGIKRTQYPKNKHTNVSNIVGQFSRSKTPLRTTMKSHARV